ncbi:toxin-antitoxin system YwqK family antitoxin [Parapedobacter deserti]|uniref:Toxin-antitoxin system YwqK family antitoxin n=1 Tax=Parapedobacter deserti TaxID=1912957 RepID=A0ABV7JGW0_9SPHI
MRKQLIFIFTVCTGMAWCIPVSAQRYLENAIPYRNSALLRTDGGITEVNFTKKEYLGRAEPGIIYYSFYRDSIYRTQGGYHGRPLHGRYVERYPDRSLKVLGNYVYGLRNGKWQHWDNGGVLRKVSRWKEGKETGRFAIYDTTGRLRQKGFLLDGKFNGIVSTFHARDTIQLEKARYDYGTKIETPKRKVLGSVYDRFRSLFGNRSVAKSEDSSDLRSIK